jgi:hypothetical protein
MQEAYVGGLWSEASLNQKHKILSEKTTESTHTQKGGMEDLGTWLKPDALSSNLSAVKKKKKKEILKRKKRIIRIIKGYNE